MNAKQKLKQRSGFTLAETLLAVLILLMVSTIVANGIPVAKNAYDKVVTAANAKVLLSTTIAALRDELTTAQNVKVGTDNKTVTYYSADNGSTSQISIADDSNVIMLQEYIDLNPTATAVATTLHSVAPRGLVPKMTATGDLVIRYDSAALSGASPTAKDTITFYNLAVTRKGKTEKLASVNTLTIRLIKPTPAG